MGIAIRPTIEAIPKAISSGRNRDSGTRRTTGRAVAMRRMKSPIAAMIATKTTARAAMSRGVAAVSEIEGMTNCGCGPGFGPTANSNAPRTGWPSTEITRQ
jgi:hypothetical protein